MTKLEELKAVLEELNAPCDEPPTLFDLTAYEYRRAELEASRRELTEELLPPLIAIAEAAKEMLSECRAKIVDGSRISYEPDRIDLYGLAYAVRDLNKDADK